MAAAKEPDRCPCPGREGAGEERKGRAGLGWAWWAPPALGTRTRSTPRSPDPARGAQAGPAVQLPQRPGARSGLSVSVGHARIPNPAHRGQQQQRQQEAAPRPGKRHLGRERPRQCRTGSRSGFTRFPRFPGIDSPGRPRPISGLPSIGGQSQTVWSPRYSRPRPSTPRPIETKRCPPLGHALSGLRPAPGPATCCDCL